VGGSLLEALQDLVSRQATFARPFGFRVRDVSDGECTLLVPFHSDFERPGGMVAGHVFMAAADVAMWLAIKTRRGLEDDSVTVSLQSSFLRSARREDIVCRARVTKAGSRLSHGTAECSRVSGEILSQHNLIYVRPGR
jgi:acyl-coenzyme A thioesterase PaaI-like protein